VPILYYIIRNLSSTAADFLWKCPSFYFTAAVGRQCNNLFFLLLLFCCPETHSQLITGRCAAMIISHLLCRNSWVCALFYRRKYTIYMAIRIRWLWLFYNTCRYRECIIIKSLKYTHEYIKVRRYCGAYIIIHKNNTWIFYRYVSIDIDVDDDVY